MTTTIQSCMSMAIVVLKFREKPREMSMATAVLQFREKPRETAMIEFSFICILSTGSHANMTESYGSIHSCLAKHFSANPTKWSNTLKQFVGKLPTNRLSVFGHFVGLELKCLSKSISNKITADSCTITNA